MDYVFFCVCIIVTCSSLKAKLERDVCEAIGPVSIQRKPRFLDHLNGLHRNIQFTMETEKDGHIPFLDIDIYRRPDGSLGHKVYRKPTHTNLYLYPESHHYPSNKQAVLATLV
jgi:hypothetical protein